MKTCSACRKILDDSMFHKRLNGLQSECKECLNAKNRIRNKTPHRLEYNRLRWRKNYQKFKKRYLSRPSIKKRYAAYQRKYRNDPRLRMRNEARWQVARAIKAGLLERKPCEICGKKSEAHHDDYYKPLEVRWLCRDHHAEFHRNHNAMLNKEG